MKKSILLALIMCLGLALQAQENPNRMIVQPKGTNAQGFLIERIDSIYFAEVKGRVAADVTFKEFKTGEADTVVVSVAKTPDCRSFRINCIPSVTAAMLKDDATAADYFDRMGGNFYHEDFTNGEMTGFPQRFKADTKYTVITMGYDQYGIACSVSKAEFTTPKPQLVGNPTVTWTIDKVGQKSFTATFTPNDDCKSFGTCLFEAGTAEQQFEQFGPMFGFANMGDMIMQFSQVAHTGVYTHEWTNLAPGTDYEVYVQPLDKNGNYGDMVIMPVTTAKMGGEGLATVEITIGEFGQRDDKYFQNVTYTPNDQASVHHDMIIEKQAFNRAEWGEEGVLKYLKTDNSMDPYWDQYGVDNATWNADPSTEYIAFSLAKNANGEWGTLARKDFTTPASPSSVAAKASKVGKRLQNGGMSAQQAGVSPLNLKHMAASKGMKLEQK